MCPLVKVGIAYSGKSSGKTQNKVIHLDLDDGEAFWQGLRPLKIAKVFDLSKLKEAIIGGDKAGFIRIGQKLFCGAFFRLGPFHVARAIKGALGWT